MTAAHPRLARLALLALACTLAAGPARAGVPGTIGYQGRLYDASSVPIDGTLPVTFALYAAASGGSAVWLETQQVTFTNGYFAVELGAVTPLTPAALAMPSLYLGVAVDADPEMTPRATLASVPYALVAGDVLGDIHPSSVSVNGALVIDGNGRWVGSSQGMAPRVVDASSAVLGTLVSSAPYGGPGQPATFRVLNAGFLFTVDAVSGAFQVPQQTLYHDAADCTGATFAEALDAPQAAFGEVGLTSPGQPLYAWSSLPTVVAYASHSDGVGGCTSETGSASLSPVAPVGVFPAPAAGPLSVQ